MTVFVTAIATRILTLLVYCGSHYRSEILGFLCLKLGGSMNQSEPQSVEENWGLSMRSIRRLALLTISLIASMPLAMAQQSLVDAYDAGHSFDPRFKAAYHQFQAAREAVPQAFAGLLPVISLEGRQGQQRQQIFERDNPFFGVGDSRFATSSFVFQANQPIYRHSSWVRLSQSKAFVRQSHALFVAAEQDLILRTAEAYLNVLAARDNVEFTETEKAAVDAQVELVEGRRRGGLATITDEYEANARAAQVQADIITTQYALDDAYQALREIVGDAVTEVMRLKDDIALTPPDPLDLNVWIERALAQNYSLAARNEAVTVADYEVKRRRAAHLPTLDLVARHGNNETGGAVTGGGSDTNTTEVGLQLSVPIYSGGAVRSQTRESKQLYYRALEERNLQHLVTMRETRGAFLGVRNSINQISALKAAARSLEIALDGRTKGYRSGVNTLLDVLDAERELTSIKRDYARARYDYLLNFLRLKAQTGALSASDLLHINSMLETQSTQNLPTAVSKTMTFDNKRR